MATSEEGLPSAGKTAGDAPAGRFAGRAAFVTGVSDRGIGGAIVERFAREGASVMVSSRHEPARLIKRLRRAAGSIRYRTCDVTDRRQVDETLAESVAEFGRLDIVVNNAGVEIARRLDEFAESEWQSMLHTNLEGAIRVSQAALPHLGAGGVIVNIASALALGGCSGFSIYSASKAGMIGLTQSLAWELAPRQIRVVGVAPGLVHTPMIHKHIEHLTPEVRSQIEACHPLGMGLPHDVAAAVAFLASDDARWITGVTLPLGWTQAYPLPTSQFTDPVG